MLVRRNDKSKRIEWINQWMDEWMNGWMNEWMNQRMNGWTKGWWWWWWWWWCLSNGNSINSNGKTRPKKSCLICIWDLHIAYTSWARNHRNDVGHLGGGVGGGLNAYWKRRMEMSGSSAWRRRGDPRDPRDPTASSDAAGDRRNAAPCRRWRTSPFSASPETTLRHSIVTLHRSSFVFIELLLFFFHSADLTWVSINY